MMKELSLMQKEFPLSYSLTRFPMGWIEYFIYILLFCLFMYHVVYLRYKYHHMQSKFIKVQKTDTKFSDIIGGVDKALMSTKRKSRILSVI